MRAAFSRLCSSRRGKAALGGGALALIAAVAAAVLISCGTSSIPLIGNQAGDEGGSSACPATQKAPAVLPGVTAQQRALSYWLERQPRVDEVVLSPRDIAAHNAAFEALARQRPDDDPLTHFDLLSPEDPKRLLEELRTRLDYMRERLDDGRYVDERGEQLSSDDKRAFAAVDRLPELDQRLRVALAPIPLRCGPRPAGLYKGPEVDTRFDRNNCSTLRPQEPLRVLASWAGGTLLVRSGYALGWVAKDAPLSPPLSAEHAERFTRGDKLRAQGKLSLPSGAIADKTLLTADGERALVATKSGVSTSRKLSQGEAVSSHRPLTRRALLTEAFAYLDTPYGWGGAGEGRDCSRFLMDVLAAFGLRLPRHSGTQAKAGSMVIDVPKEASLADRQVVIDAAAERGIVLLHFPGHIMLYLGRTAEGTPMVIHAFAEYLASCAPAAAKDAGRDETLFTVDRVQLSDLSLGRGTTRRSFLERITHVTVLGKTPGQALQGVSARRPPAPMGAPPDDCRDAADVSMMISPRRPHPGAPLRITVSGMRDLGSLAISLHGPDGQHVPPEVHTVGGPPYGYWASFDSPAAGKWTVQVGEGDRVEACRKFRVFKSGDKLQGPAKNVWIPRRSWNRHSENLYSTWVEQLLDYPLDDTTWPNLQALLKDPSKNVLYNHLGQGEDDKLELGPDCADLPYFLRAYYAWKRRLPFSYRHCNRGKKGKAPYCDRELHDHLVDTEATTAVTSFKIFARDNIANGVHSGTGRTAPEDEHTDYYPIPLTREALVPGTIFADPYGHLFVIADWIPQGIGDYGVLVGADAQPDGTIGRRRFWRGSFLFTPDTTEAGAGFKAFRPVRYGGGTIRPVKNADIGGGLTPFSLQQYQGSKDDFYDRVEALINPRPLDPKQMLDVLMTALFEQVKRRVVSVDNGEKYKAETRKTVDMPHGHSIFETTGPWEDFSTPSRDMRLLIAMDTVTGFPAVVKRSPERFDVAKASVGATATELESYLSDKLAQMRFSYRNSNGASVELSVKDVLDRAKDFEMAYNPNDCVEIRWAAPEGSAERSSCKRHAPQQQTERMRSYRSWFANRTRPSR